jgi:hypothetical protein
MKPNFIDEMTTFTEEQFDSLIKPPKPESLVIPVKRRSVVGDVNLRQVDKIRGIVIND